MKKKYEKKIYFEYFNCKRIYARRVGYFASENIVSRSITGLMIEEIYPSIFCL